MKNQSVISVDFKGRTLKRKSLLSVIGFVLMLAGPSLLWLATLYQKWLGNLSELWADAVSKVSLVLPGIGFVLSIICLFMWKRTGNVGRALSIVTVILCNPFFYFIYIVICSLSSYTLAGLPWM